MASLGCAVMCVGLPGVSDSCAAAAPLEKAIKLTQVHNFMGTFDVTIARNGIRFENTSQLKFIMVSSAPDWKITVYRTDDKTYFSESLAELEDTGLFSGFLFTRKERVVNLKYFRLAKMKMGGLDIDRMTSHESTVKTMKLAPYMPPQIERIFYAVYKLPTNGGIPIGFSAVHVNSDFLQGTPNKGRIESYLDTTKVSTAMVSPSLFKVPPGLKRAPSLRDVAAGKSARAHSEDVRVLWDK